MKTKFQLAAIVSACFMLHSALGQGALTPPGAPAPTMKTLDQIEARTPITNATGTVTISQPGSYYLTRNLTISIGDGIDINTNQVTLDLNGFTISSISSPASGYGISMQLSAGNTDITILNGHIKGGGTNNAGGVFSGPGFTSGIDWPSAAPQNCRVTGVSVSGCYDGINLGNPVANAGNATWAESCTVKSASHGIIADNISHCAVKDCGLIGIWGLNVSDSRSDTIGSSTAISCGNGLVNGCFASSISGTAITARIATACIIASGITNITYKYNMP